MIVFLTEEESMKVTLERLISTKWPTAVQGVEWIVLCFQGKSDLEKNVLTKMQQWNYGDPHFIVLRVKERLRQKADGAGKPFSVRIVCNELESWFLGELNAVEAAFPASRATLLKNTAKYRNPDLLTNASDELHKLVDISGKVSRAKAIAEHFKPDDCVSHSFSELRMKVLELMPSV
jgi:hypothetical protein